MNNFFIIFCAVFVINLVRCDVASEILQSCKVQENATDKDVEDYQNRIEPLPRIAKCWAACFNEKMGWVVDNKLNVSAIEIDIGTNNDDQLVIAELKAIVNECKDVTDEDRCEMVIKVDDCVMEGLKKRNLEVNS